jgi:dCTP diphosphatase
MTEFRPDVSLEDIRVKLEAFAAERGWEQFHTPRNLLLAMTGEVGELAELFQWTPDSECGPGLPAWPAPKKAHLGEELADVYLYLTRLADRCGVDLASAVLRKLEKNAVKYPASLAFGKSDKYTAYQQRKEEVRASDTAVATTKPATQ